MNYSYVTIFLLFRNIECGTLHCQGGISKPLISQSTYSSHTQTVNGQEVQCKVTSAVQSDLSMMGGGPGGPGGGLQGAGNMGIISGGNIVGVGMGGPGMGGSGLGGPGMEQQDLGMVQDGTKCGEEMVSGTLLKTPMDLKVLSWLFHGESLQCFKVICDCHFQICLNQSCISLLPLKSYTRCPADSQNIECSGKGVRFFLKCVHWLLLI